MLEMVAWKIIYYTYMFVIPYFITNNISFGFWLICFFSLHFVAGFILATIFQTAHIMPECDYPKANENGTIENNAKSQKNKPVSDFKKLFVDLWKRTGLKF